MTYTQLPAILIKIKARKTIDNIDTWRQEELNKLIYSEIRKFERRKNNVVRKFFRKLFSLQEPIIPTREEIIKSLSDCDGNIFAPIDYVKILGEAQRKTAQKIFKLADQAIQNGSSDATVFISADELNIIS